MKQGRLFRREKSIPSKVRSYEEGNIESARIIAADPDKYHPASGLSIWAHSVLRKLKEEQVHQ
jgi:hypothetical protein